MKRIRFVCREDLTYTISQLRMREDSPLSIMPDDLGSGPWHTSEIRKENRASMTTGAEASQIPSRGPLSTVSEDGFYGEVQYLHYGGSRHLRKAYRVPIELLHFNIENGRYATKFSLLKAANPGVLIDPRQDNWKSEILKMLNGTWDNPRTGATTRNERSHFEELVADLEDRGQERTGIVLEDGGVMSGNRRLAALMTLAQAHPVNEQFKYLHAFIVPADGVSAADRWRLEISAQTGVGRMQHEYEPVERLIKMREGVSLLVESGRYGSEEEAVRVVANDFGRDVGLVRKDLESLRHIDNYLEAIGKSDQYWLANELTEVFTEMQALEDSMRVNSLPVADRERLKRGVYFIVKHQKADYRLMRDIRAAVGPTRRRKDAQTVQSAVQAILDAVPTADDLEQEPNDESDEKADGIVDRFKAEFQAGRPGSLVAKAVRAESNMKAVKDALEHDAAPSGSVADELKDTIKSVKNLSDESLELLG